MLNIFIQNHFDSILDLSVIFNSVGFMNDSGSAHFFSGADNCSFFMNGKFFPSLLHVVIQASCLLFFAGL